jgi:hypothetical protein
VATNGATPLTCEGGICTAEISAFCLQEYRGEPARGTAYNLVDPTKILLVASAADGREIRRSVGHVAHLTVTRGQYALRISLPQDMLAAMGSRDAAIVVAPLASAIPVPVVGDPNPLTEQEIALAAGPLRTAAQPIVAGNEQNAVAARITNRLLNLLPPEGNGTRVAHNRAFDTALGARRSSPNADYGVVRATEAFHTCRTLRMVDGGVKRCLETAHDRFMGFVNIDYWRAVGAGS